MTQSEHIQDLPAHQRVTFDQLANLAQYVRDLFEALTVEIRSGSVLDAFLRHVDKMATRFREGKGQNLKEMVDFTTAMRLIDSILAAKDDLGAVNCYQRIARKDVDLFSSTQSQGKDALWELQLVKDLKLRGISATLSEPDINVIVGDVTIPIACKKIYSIKNLEGQLRSAGKQLKAWGGAGIAALNIDAQLPKDHIIAAAGSKEASGVLLRVAENFLATHQKLIRRLISAGKFDAVLVSVSCPMDNKNVRPRFNVGTETMVWCPSGIGSVEGRMRTAVFSIAMALPLYDPNI